MPPIVCPDMPEFEPVECIATPECDQLPWYALQIQSRLAAIASATLCSKGFETFLPLYSTRRRWSDRMKEIEVPLFPGYLFCRFDVRHRVPVLATPGLIGIVGAGRVPIAVEEEEIAAIRIILRSGLTARSHRFMIAGSKVCIESGPLAGVEGVLVSTDKLDRLVVSVNLLQRSVAVEIDRKWVRPIAEPPDLRSGMYERMSSVKP